MDGSARNRHPYLKSPAANGQRTRVGTEARLQRACRSFRKPTDVGGEGGKDPDTDAAGFRARRTELGLGPLVIHANYLINLAHPSRCCELALSSVS